MHICARGSNLCLCVDMIVMMPDFMPGWEMKSTGVQSSQGDLLVRETGAEDYFGTQFLYFKSSPLSKAYGSTKLKWCRFVHTSLTAIIPVLFFFYLYEPPVSCCCQISCFIVQFCHSRLNFCLHSVSPSLTLISLSNLLCHPPWHHTLLIFVILHFQFTFPPPPLPLSA